VVSGRFGTVLEEFGAKPGVVIPVRNPLEVIRSIETNHHPRSPGRGGAEGVVHVTGAGRTAEDPRSEALNPVPAVLAAVQRPALAQQPGSGAEPGAEGIGCGHSTSWVVSIGPREAETFWGGGQETSAVRPFDPKVPERRSASARDLGCGGTHRLSIRSPFLSIENTFVTRWSGSPVQLKAYL
jgi:hypothetical protein